VASLWRWSDKAADQLKEFALPNKQVYLFLLPQDFTHSQLNAIWGMDLDKGEWHTFWHALWTSDLTTNGKVFLWRVFSQGLFTGSQALKIPIGDGCCFHCPGTIDLSPHIPMLPLFHSSHEAMLAYDLWSTSASRILPNYFTLVWSNLQATPTLTARLFMLYQIGWTLWLNQNAYTF
jgi:hypothetical protein